MNQKITSKFNVLILIAISFAVMYFTLKDNFMQIISSILDINIWWFLLSIFLIVGYWFFRALSYQSIIVKFDKEYKIKRSFGLIMLTQFFNAITPFSSGGQPLVVYTLKKDGLRAVDGTNVVIMDFITYQIALVLLGTIAVIYNQVFNIFEDTFILKELVTAGYLINFVVVVSLFLISFAKKFNHFFIRILIKILSKLKFIKNKEVVLDKWENRINTFHDGASILFKDKTLFIRLIGINTIALLAVYIVPLTLLFSFRNYTSFNGIESIAASAYVNLIGSFVPIPGGTGGLEYAFVAFFSNFINGSLVNAMMLLWRFITYYLGLIIGALVFNIWKRRD